MHWVVDKIYVLSPIGFTSIRRNEVNSKISGSNVSTGHERRQGRALSRVVGRYRQQRAATVLRDVHYVIDAHFEMTRKAAPSDNEGNSATSCAVGSRRDSAITALLRLPGVSGAFQKWEGGEIVTAYPDSGPRPRPHALRHRLYRPRNITPMFFRAQAQKGVLNVPAPGESGGAAMILQSLVDYYEALAARGEIARPGWGKTKIAFALELDENGQLVRVVPLCQPLAGREKQRPADGISPHRSSARHRRRISCGTIPLTCSASTERASRSARKDCFKAAKELHLSLLSALDDPFARAICRFFERWEPEKCGGHALRLRTTSTTS
jgi:hypothetical protein